MLLNLFEMWFVLLYIMWTLTASQDDNEMKAVRFKAVGVLFFDFLKVLNVARTVLMKTSKGFLIHIYQKYIHVRVQNIIKLSEENFII